ncbi:MAG: hypothetical protein ACYCTX_08850, partial [Thermoplasmataceae archaeon]
MPGAYYPCHEVSIGPQVQFAYPTFMLVIDPTGHYVGTCPMGKVAQSEVSEELLLFMYRHI